MAAISLSPFLLWCKWAAQCQLPRWRTQIKTKGVCSCLFSQNGVWLPILEEGTSNGKQLGKAAALSLAFEYVLPMLSETWTYQEAVCGSERPRAKHCHGTVYSWHQLVIPNHGRLFVGLVIWVFLLLLFILRGDWVLGCVLCRGHFAKRFMLFAYHQLWRCCVASITTSWCYQHDINVRLT